MTTLQYLTALKKLDLSPQGQRTAAALGLSLRQLGRLAYGEQLPTRTVELLLECLLRKA
jgi:hypothetical protein